MTREESRPAVWRERVQLTQTIKDGWRVGEVTVEVTFNADDPISENERQKRLNAAIQSGQNVADQRNHLRNATITNEKD